MKTIDQHNLEEMLFLYMEGLLEPTECRQVEEYVAAHSEAQELMQLYDPLLTLPKELPLNGKDGKPLTFPDKESLHSTAMAGIQKPTQQQETPVVPLSGNSRFNGLRRTLSAAACAAALLIFGIEIVRHGGNPAVDNSHAIASLRNDMLQQGNTQHLALAFAEAETQQPLREEQRQDKEHSPIEQRSTARADLNIAELQAVAEALQSARHIPSSATDITIVPSHNDYHEDIAAMQSDMQSAMLSHISFDMPEEVLIVDDLIVYYDSMSLAGQAWSHILTESPALAYLSEQWARRAEADSTLTGQPQGNVLQRIASRWGWKKASNGRNDFNNIGAYFAEAGQIKQNTLKRIADGRDTLSQRFATFAKSSLQEERFAIHRKN